MKWIIIVLPLLLTSCTKYNSKNAVYNVYDTHSVQLGKTIRKKRKYKRCNDHAQEEYQVSLCQQEAKQYDIPLPLTISSHPLNISESASHENIVFSYDVEKMTMFELRTFFEHEMEWCGWQRISTINNGELLMVYKKPCRVCVVSLRPSSVSKEQFGSIHLVIFVGRRTAG